MRDWCAGSRPVTASGGGNIQRSTMTSVVLLATVASVFVAARSAPARAALEASQAAMVSPNPSSNENELTSVSADSPTDAWAVGTYLYDTRGIHGTLTLHWDGTSWSKVRSPSPSGFNNNALYAVSASSATDVWAVGYYTSDETGFDKTLTLHWDGRRWSQVKSPNGD